LLDHHEAAVEHAQSGQPPGVGLELLAHAGAIDTPLPVPRRVAHIELASKPEWVALQRRRGDDVFDEYPDYSLAQWHERHYRGR